MKKTFLTSFILSVFLSTAPIQGHGTTFNISPKLIQTDKSDASSAQPDSIPKTKLLYKVWIKTQKNENGPFGLYQTMDSALVIAKTRNWFEPGITPLDTIAIQKIKNIQVRKNGKASKGLLIGIIVGGTAGALLANATYEPCEPSRTKSCLLYPSRSFSTTISMVVGTAIGAFAGGVPSGLRTYFEFQGEKSQYTAQREKLKQFSIRGQ